jgi:predicted nucleic acid-binding protein
VLTVALEQGLSSYDASHFDLAIREGLPLATIDRKRASAATCCGVALLVET